MSPVKKAERNNNPVKRKVIPELVDDIHTVYLRCMKDRKKRGMYNTKFVRRDYDKYRQQEVTSRAIELRFGSWTRALLISGIELDHAQTSRSSDKYLSIGQLDC